MSAIRILHASDIHLGNVPKRRSILDQGSITTELMRGFLSGLKDNLLSGDLSSLKETFKGILSSSNIAFLEAIQQMADREQRNRLNEKINQTLSEIALSDDPIFRDFVADLVRKVTFATSYHPLALDSLVNFILSQDLRAVILSGDISTTGFEHDLRKAKEFLEGPETTASTFAASEPILANLGIPVWILPGNHDRFTYTAEEWFFSPGGTLFDEMLSKHWEGKVKYYSPLRDSQDSLSVLILAADFSLKQSKDSTRLHRFNKLAQGRVYEDILDELESETLSQQERERDEFPENQFITLWAIHFPPFFPGLATSKSLLQEANLLGSAEKLNVQALLTGHTHIAKDYHPTRRVRVLCAGTPTQHDSAAKHCQIISVKRHEGGPPYIDVTHYEWDQENVTFRRRQE